MDPKQVGRVTDKLAAQAEADRELRYTKAVAGWAIALSVAIWATFFLWEDFREKLMKDGLWWLPLAATLMIAVAVMFAHDKRSHPPSSG